MQAVTQFLPAFLLVFCRITSFFVVVPVFSFQGAPMQFRIGLSFFVSLIAFIAMGPVDAMSFDVMYLVSVAREIMIGLILGFASYLFFTVVQIAGSFLDMQMGFGIANVIDPMTGAQSPILGNLKYMIAMLFFLSINGHHYLLRAIMDSYKWVPLDNSFFANVMHGQVSTFLFDSFVQVFYLAFQVAAPIIASLFLVDVAMGILAKTAPQFNVFIIGFQLKIFVGFILLMIMMATFLFVFQQLFSTMLESMMNLLQLLNKQI